MKIAYIAPTGVFGGVRIVAEHLNRLTDRGHDCTLVALDPQPINWLATRFAQRHLTDAGSGYDVVVGTTIASWPTARQMADDNQAKAMSLMQMAEWMLIPRGSSQRDDAMRWFATPLDGVMAISEWLAQLCDSVDNRVTHRIRNGIDLSQFYHDPFPDIPPFDGVTVMIEGYTHSAAKDIDSLAYSAVRRARADHGLSIRTLGLSQFEANFEFDRFWQNPAQHIVRKIYSSADIFLKASRWEGRPGPDLEAMACGAVVCRAIDLGGDDLLHGVNCLTTAYHQSQEFRQHFVQLCLDGAKRDMLRRQALEYVRANCDWNRVMDDVEKALTGRVTVPTQANAMAAYELDAYNPLQNEIVAWEGGQASWLGETLANMLRPTSVIDIGCGPGIYLVPFKPHAEVLGVDGASAAGKALEPHEFVHADLRTDWAPAKHYDLSLCIETGEHLPPDRADYLVDLLTSHSTTCFFSAAQPGQGGFLHLNEQPSTYWVQKFRARGWDYHPLHDALMAKIQANADCRRVQWLIGNSILMTRVHHDHE